MVRKSGLRFAPLEPGESFGPAFNKHSVTLRSLGDWELGLENLAEKQELTNLLHRFYRGGTEKDKYLSVY